MKKVLAVGSAVILTLVIVLPVVIVFVTGKGLGPVHNKVNVHEEININVYMPEKNKTVTMGLEQYVKGVLAAEMPAEFEIEALKAQAIAARTYAVKQMPSFGGKGLAEHPGADVSADFRQGQAWLDEAKLTERWGKENYQKYWKKISMAVDETRGQIAVYQDEPIQAVFHSTSGERTASAKEVWGVDYPYLASVPCTWDQKSPRYSDTKEFALTELEQRLGADAGVIPAAQGGGGLTDILGLTTSGRVDKVRIGSKILSGIALREKLELRSANFTIERKADKVVFKTTGYGHGVGLCQYGANGMAKEGKDYRKILTYYYTGISLKNIYAN